MHTKGLAVALPMVVWNLFSPTSDEKTDTHENNERYLSPEHAPVL